MKILFPFFLSAVLFVVFSCKQNSSAHDASEEVVMVQNEDAQPAASVEEQQEQTPDAIETSEAPKGSAPESRASAEKPMPAVSNEAKPIATHKAEDGGQTSFAAEKTEPEAEPSAEKEPVKPSETKAEQPIKKAAFSHDLWDELLRKYVSSSGYVNYVGMRSEKANLDKYLAQLAANPPQKGWSRNEEMAYWINAYNAFTVKLILDHYPVKSIRDIHSGNPWDVKWIELGGNTYSLNQIENDKLRKRFGDARIHFAVNCAARSCPPLLNRAWTASSLSQTLDQRAKAFINNPKYNQISPSAAKVSKIFEWYAADFGDLRTFLNKYSKTSLEAGATIQYLEYDWSLNGK